MLDLIVPCYNPGEGWAISLAENFIKLQSLLPEVSIHLILVNDGSTRGVYPATIQYLQEKLPLFTYLFQDANMGKGSAIRIGVRHSTAAFCLYTDIDFPYQEASIAKIYHVLQAGEADVAVGVREQGYYAFVPPFRRRISKLLQNLSDRLLQMPINDTQCGLKGFNRRGRIFFLQTKIDRYLFDLEFIYLASRTPSSLIMLAVEVELKPGIVFSKLDARVLLREGYCFCKIFFRSVRQKFS